MTALKLLTTSSTKIEHSNNSGSGYISAILYLAPAMASGRNLCAFNTPGCSAACLYTAGRAKLYPMVNEARIRKSREFYSDREGFMRQLVKDIQTLNRKAYREGKQVAIRLNGTSDIAWEHVPCFSYKSIMKFFPSVTFYDYTKYPPTMRRDLPKNYTLTASRSELSTERDILDNVSIGRNVAVVFNTHKGQSLPTEYLGVPVLDGDITDERFLDPSGHIVGLRAKGDARGESSGFVVAA